MDIPCPNVYRPRRPQDQPLYKLVAQNLDTFYEAYDHSFLDTHGPLTKTSIRALEGFLRCGRLAFGFGRARCTDCGHESLVPFSCQLRGVCPSCQQKRAEILCRVVREEVIEPVAHRQLVFVLPRNLRRLFYGQEMLTLLCRTAVDATTEFYRTGLGLQDLKVGMMVIPQFFGDRLNHHLHLHSLISDGAFDTEGNFYRLAMDMEHDIAALNTLWTKRVLDALVKNKRMTPQHRDDRLQWRHTGFSVDGSVKVTAGDHGRLERLIRYMARPAIAFDRVSYDANTGKVVVRGAKKRAGMRKVVAQYYALEFLSLLALQVPPPRTHMVRYYGYYSNAARGKRRKRDEGADSPNPQQEETPSPKASLRRMRWAELIRKVFEVEPLACPKCPGEMKLIAFITQRQSDVIEKILTQLGEDDSPPKATGPPIWLQRLQAAEHNVVYAHVYDVDDAPKEENYDVVTIDYDMNWGS